MDNRSMVLELVVFNQEIESKKVRGHLRLVKPRDDFQDLLGTPLEEAILSTLRQKKVEKLAEEIGFPEQEIEAFFSEFDYERTRCLDEVQKHPIFQGRPIAVECIMFLLEEKGLVHFEQIGDTWDTAITMLYETGPLLPTEVGLKSYS